MWIRSSFFVVLAAALCGCSFSVNYDNAKKASDLFHRQMGRGDYAAIYDTATEGFRASGPRDTLMKFLARVNRKMGKCGESPATVSGYQATTSGTYITTTSSRVCATGTLGEQFVWLMVAGKATLLKYNANNPLLLTD